MTDQEYMQRALHLALKAKGKTSPNPLVGALIVKGTKIIAEGWHKRCGADHAEIVALKQAGSHAKGVRLFVTLEPCFHFGRTPPCVDQIIKSGIKEVIIGMRDPNPLTDGRSIAKLKRAGIKTKVHVLEKELKQMNEVFSKYIKTNMPFVAIKCAQSLDGKIATSLGDSKWITSSKTRQSARRIRDEFDAICVGIQTVLKDNPRLNGLKKSKTLKKIILDSTLRIPPNARLFNGIQPSDCIIATTKKAPKNKMEFLKNKGIRVLTCPERQGCVDLKWLFKELAKYEITSILMEGGAHTIGCALKENLVDKIYVYLAPKFIGDQNALSSIVGLNPSRIRQAIQLKRLTIKKIDQDIFITGYVHRNH